MSSQDPIALTFKGQHKTWWYGGSVIAILLGLLVANGGSSGSLGLDVRRGDFFMRDDGKTLRIINSGKQPVTITKLSVNGRSDCTLFTGMKTGDDLFPFELKIGDRFDVNSSCRIVRVEVSSNNGSSTYEFGG